MNYWLEVLRDLHGAVIRTAGLSPVQVRALYPEARHDVRPPALVRPPHPRDGAYIEFPYGWRRVGDPPSKPATTEPPWSPRPRRRADGIEHDTLDLPADPAVRYAPGVRPTAPHPVFGRFPAVIEDPSQPRNTVRIVDPRTAGIVTRPANRDHHTAGRVAYGGPRGVTSMLAARARSRAAGHDVGAVVRFRGPWGELWIDGDRLPLRIDPPASRDVLFGPGAVRAHGWDIGERRMLLDELGRYGTERTERADTRARITITGIS